MLTDVGGLVLALFASWVATRPPTPEKTYGYYRVAILAALVNALVLLGVAGAILVAAYHRIVRAARGTGGPMLGVATLGLAANLGGAWLLRADATASLGVRACTWRRSATRCPRSGHRGRPRRPAERLDLADPLVSAAIGVFIVPRTWGCCGRRSTCSSRGPVAPGTGGGRAGARRGVGVRRVHDLHVWTLTSGREAMSAHVVVEDLAGGERILERLHALLHARFGIDHTTIQLEREPRPY